MNKKQMMYIAVVSMTALSLAVVAVTARSEPLNTPLYTFRMEQASSEMNFLPTDKNTFTYMSEKGYTLEYNAANSCCEAILGTSSYETCYSYYTCVGYYTCSQTCDGFTHGGYTCLPTCYNWWTCNLYTCSLSCNDFTCVGVFTCMGTCVQTCPETCDTCYDTCWSTCEGQGWTCNATGCQSTCSTCDQPTCPPTCWETCEGPTCADTCWETCEVTCDTCAKTCGEDCGPDP